MDNSEDILEKYRDIFEDLASSLICPACNGVVKKPFYNLGETYSWAEGCKECSEKQE